jgi:uncharacterized membrane protein HdeD (DUF308 family)
MAAGSTAAGQGTGTRWWVLVLVGVLAIIVGFVAVVLPGPTLLVVGILFGANLMVWGIFMLVMAFGEHLGVAHTLLRVIVGVLGVLAGLVCLVHPGTGVVAVLLATSFWFILTGIADLVAGIHRAEGRWLSILLGVVGIVAGIIIVANPAIGLTTLVLLVGIGFMARGVIEVAAGLALRRSPPARPAAAT